MVLTLELHGSILAKLAAELNFSKVPSLLAAITAVGMCQLELPLLAQSSSTQKNHAVIVYPNQLASPAVCIGLKDGNGLCAFNDYLEQADKQSADATHLNLKLDLYDSKSHICSLKTIEIDTNYPPAIRNCQVLPASRDGLAQLVAAKYSCDRRYFRLGATFFDSEHIGELVEYSNLSKNGSPLRRYELHQLDLKRRTRTVIYTFEKDTEAQGLVGLSDTETIVFTAPNQFAIFNPRTRKLSQSRTNIPIYAHAFARLADGTIAVAGARKPYQATTFNRYCYVKIDTILVIDTRRKVAVKSLVLPDVSQCYWGKIWQLASGEIAVIGESRNFAEESLLRENKILSPVYFSPAVVAQIPPTQFKTLHP